MQSATKSLFIATSFLAAVFQAACSDDTSTSQTIAPVPQPTLYFCYVVHTSPAGAVISSQQGNDWYALSDGGYVSYYDYRSDESENDTLTAKKDGYVDGSVRITIRPGAIHYLTFDAVETAAKQDPSGACTTKKITLQPIRYWCFIVHTDPAGAYVFANDQRGYLGKASGGPDSDGYVDLFEGANSWNVTYTAKMPGHEDTKQTVENWAPNTYGTLGLAREDAAQNPSVCGKTMIVLKFDTGLE